MSESAATPIMLLDGQTEDDDQLLQQWAKNAVAQILAHKQDDSHQTDERWSFVSTISKSIKFPYFLRELCSQVDMNSLGVFKDYIAEQLEGILLSEQDNSSEMTQMREQLKRIVEQESKKGGLFQELKIKLSTKGVQFGEDINQEDRLKHSNQGEKQQQQQPMSQPPAAADEEEGVFSLGDFNESHSVDDQAEKSMSLGDFMVKNTKDKSIDVGTAKQSNNDMLFDINQPAQGEHSMNEDEQIHQKNVFAAYEVEEDDKSEQTRQKQQDLSLGDFMVETSFHSKKSEQTKEFSIGQIFMNQEQGAGGGGGGNKPIQHEQKLVDSGKNADNNMPGAVDFLDGLFGFQEQQVDQRITQGQFNNNPFIPAVNAYPDGGISAKQLDNQFKLESSNRSFEGSQHEKAVDQKEQQQDQSQQQQQMYSLGDFQSFDQSNTSKSQLSSSSMSRVFKNKLNSKNIPTHNISGNNLKQEYSLGDFMGNVEDSKNSSRSSSSNSQQQQNASMHEILKQLAQRRQESLSKGGVVEDVNNKPQGDQSSQVIQKKNILEQQQQVPEQDGAAHQNNNFWDEMDSYQSEEQHQQQQQGQGESMKDNQDSFFFFDNNNKINNSKDLENIQQNNNNIGKVNEVFQASKETTKAKNTQDILSNAKSNLQVLLDSEQKRAERNQQLIENSLKAIEQSDSFIASSLGKQIPKEEQKEVVKEDTNKNDNMILHLLNENEEYKGIQLQQQQQQDQKFPTDDIAGVVTKGMQGSRNKTSSLNQSKGSHHGNNSKDKRQEAKDLWMFFGGEEEIVRNTKKSVGEEDKKIDHKGSGSEKGEQQIVDRSRVDASLNSSGVEAGLMGQGNVSFKSKDKSRTKIQDLLERSQQSIKNTQKLLQMQPQTAAVAVSNNNNSELIGKQDGLVDKSLSFDAFGSVVDQSHEESFASQNSHQNLSFLARALQTGRKLDKGNEGAGNEEVLAKNNNNTNTNLMDTQKDAFKFSDFQSSVTDSQNATQNYNNNSLSAQLVGGNVAAAIGTASTGGLGFLAGAKTDDKSGFSKELCLSDFASEQLQSSNASSTFSVHAKQQHSKQFGSNENNNTNHLKKSSSSSNNINSSIPPPSNDVRIAQNDNNMKMNASLEDAEKGMAKMEIIAEKTVAAEETSEWQQQQGTEQQQQLQQKIQYQEQISFLEDVPSPKDRSNQNSSHASSIIAEKQSDIKEEDKQQEQQQQQGYSLEQPVVVNESHEEQQGEQPNQHRGLGNKDHDSEKGHDINGNDHDNNMQVVNNHNSEAAMGENVDLFNFDGFDSEKDVKNANDCDYYNKEGFAFENNQDIKDNKNKNEQGFISQPEDHHQSDWFNNAWANSAEGKEENQFEEWKGFEEAKDNRSQEQQNEQDERNQGKVTNEEEQRGIQRELYSQQLQFGAAGGGGFWDQQEKGEEQEGKPEGTTMGVIEEQQQSQALDGQQFEDEGTDIKEQQQKQQELQDKTEEGDEQQVGQLEGQDRMMEVIHRNQINQGGYQQEIIAPLPATAAGAGEVVVEQKSIPNKKADSASSSSGYNTFFRDQQEQSSIHQKASHHSHRQGDGEEEEDDDDDDQQDIQEEDSVTRRFERAQQYDDANQRSQEEDNQQQQQSSGEEETGGQQQQEQWQGGDDEQCFDVEQQERFSQITGTQLESEKQTDGQVDTIDLEDEEGEEGKDSKDDDDNNSRSNAVEGVISEEVIEKENDDHKKEYLTNDHDGTRERNHHHHKQQHHQGFFHEDSKLVLNPEEFSQSVIHPNSEENNINNNHNNNNNNHQFSFSQTHILFDLFTSQSLEKQQAQVQVKDDGKEQLKITDNEQQQQIQDANLGETDKQLSLNDVEMTHNPFQFDGFEQQVEQQQSLEVTVDQNRSDQTAKQQQQHQHGEGQEDIVEFGVENHWNHNNNTSNQKKKNIINKSIEVLKQPAGIVNAVSSSPPAGEFNWDDFGEPHGGGSSSGNSSSGKKSDYSLHLDLNEIQGGGEQKDHRNDNEKATIVAGSSAVDPFDFLNINDSGQQGKKDIDDASKVMISQEENSQEIKMDLFGDIKDGFYAEEKSVDMNRQSQQVKEGSFIEEEEEKEIEPQESFDMNKPTKLMFKKNKEQQQKEEEESFDMNRPQKMHQQQQEKKMIEFGEGADHRDLQLQDLSFDMNKPQMMPASLFEDTSSKIAGSSNNNNNNLDGLDFLLNGFAPPRLMLVDKRSKVPTGSSSEGNLLMTPNEVVDMEAKAIFKGSGQMVESKDDDPHSQGSEQHSVGLMSMPMIQRPARKVYDTEIKQGILLPQFVVIQGQNSQIGNNMSLDMGIALSEKIDSPTQIKYLNQEIDGRNTSNSVGISFGDIEEKARRDGYNNNNRNQQNGSGKKQIKRIKSTNDVRTPGRLGLNNSSNQKGAQSLFLNHSVQDLDENSEVLLDDRFSSQGNNNNSNVNESYQKKQQFQQQQQQQLIGGDLDIDVKNNNINNNNNTKQIKELFSKEELPSSNVLISPGKENNNLNNISWEIKQNHNNQSEENGGSSQERIEIEKLKPSERSFSNQTTHLNISNQNILKIVTIDEVSQSQNERNTQRLQQQQQIDAVDQQYQQQQQGIQMHTDDNNLMGQQKIVGEGGQIDKDENEVIKENSAKRQDDTKDVNHRSQSSNESEGDSQNDWKLNMGDIKFDRNPFESDFDDDSSKRISSASSQGDNADKQQERKRRESKKSDGKDVPKDNTTNTQRIQQQPQQENQDNIAYSSQQQLQQQFLVESEFTINSDKTATEQRFNQQPESPMSLQEPNEIGSTATGGKQSNKNQQQQQQQQQKISHYGLMMNNNNNNNGMIPAKDSPSASIVKHLEGNQDESIYKFQAAEQQMQNILIKESNNNTNTNSQANRSKEELVDAAAITSNQKHSGEEVLWDNLRNQSSVYDGDSQNSNNSAGSQIWSKILEQQQQQLQNGTQQGNSIESQNTKRSQEDIIQPKNKQDIPEKDAVDDVIGFWKKNQVQQVDQQPQKHTNNIILTTESPEEGIRISQQKDSQNPNSIIAKEISQDSTEKQICSQQTPSGNTNQARINNAMSPPANPSIVIAPEPHNNNTTSPTTFQSSLSNLLPTMTAAPQQLGVNSISSDKARLSNIPTTRTIQQDSIRNNNNNNTTSNNNNNNTYHSSNGLDKSSTLKSSISKEQMNAKQVESLYTPQPTSFAGTESANDNNHNYNSISSDIQKIQQKPFEIQFSPGHQVFVSQMQYDRNTNNTNAQSDQSQQQQHPDNIFIQQLHQQQQQQQHNNVFKLATSYLNSLSPAASHENKSYQSSSQQPTIPSLQILENTSSDASKKYKTDSANSNESSQQQLQKATFLQPPQPPKDRRVKIIKEVDELLEKSPTICIPVPVQDTKNDEMKKNKEKKKKQSDVVSQQYQQQQQQVVSDGLAVQFEQIFKEMRMLSEMQKKEMEIDEENENNHGIDQQVLSLQIVNLNAKLNLLTQNHQRMVEKLELEQKIQKEKELVMIMQKKKKNQVIMLEDDNDNDDDQEDGSYQVKSKEYIKGGQSKEKDRRKQEKVRLEDRLMKKLFEDEDEEEEDSSVKEMQQNKLKSNKIQDKNSRGQPQQNRKYYTGDLDQSGSNKDTDKEEEKDSGNSAAAVDSSASPFNDLLSKISQQKQQISQFRQEIQNPSPAVVVPDFRRKQPQDGGIKAIQVSPRIQDEFTQKKMQQQQTAQDSLSENTTINNTQSQPLSSSLQRRMQAISEQVQSNNQKLHELNKTYVEVKQQISQNTTATVPSRQNSPVVVKEEISTNGDRQQQQQQLSKVITSPRRKDSSAGIPAMPTSQSKRILTEKHNNNNNSNQLSQVGVSSAVNNTYTSPNKKQLEDVESINQKKLKYLQEYQHYNEIKNNNRIKLDQADNNNNRKRSIIGSSSSSFSPTRQLEEAKEYLHKSAKIMAQNKGIYLNDFDERNMSPVASFGQRSPTNGLESQRQKQQLQQQQQQQQSLPSSCTSSSSSSLSKKPPLFRSNQKQSAFKGRTGEADEEQQQQQQQLYYSKQLFSHSSPESTQLNSPVERTFGLPMDYYQQQQQQQQQQMQQENHRFEQQIYSDSNTQQPFGATYTSMSKQQQYQQPSQHQIPPFMDTFGSDKNLSSFKSNSFNSSQAQPNSLFPTSTPAAGVGRQLQQKEILVLSEQQQQQQLFPNAPLLFPAVRTTVGSGYQQQMQQQQQQQQAQPQLQQQQLFNPGNTRINTSFKSGFSPSPRIASNNIQVPRENRVPNNNNDLPQKLSFSSKILKSTQPVWDPFLLPTKLTAEKQDINRANQHAAQSQSPSQPQQQQQGFGQNRQMQQQLQQQEYPAIAAMMEFISTGQQQQQFQQQLQYAMQDQQQPQQQFPQEPYNNLQQTHSSSFQPGKTLPTMNGSFSGAKPQENIRQLLISNTNVYKPVQDSQILLNNRAYRESNFNYSINQYKKNFVSKYYGND